MMAKFELTAHKLGHLSEVKINGAPVPATSYRLDVGIDQITTLEVGLILTEPIKIDGEGRIVIHGQPINDDLGRLLYQSLADRYGDTPSLESPGRAEISD